MELHRCLMCPKPAKSAKAKYCGDTCRKRAQRRPPATVVPMPAAETTPPTEGTVLRATRRELEAAGREGTMAGALALALATRIDAGEDLGSTVAGMVRELRATMAEALEGAAVKADGIDEVRAARERRLARVGS